MKKALIVFIVLVMALVIPTFIPVGSEDPKGEVEIYLVANEIHTDIVLPVKNALYDWTTFIDPNSYSGSLGEWVEFGWGDRQFYFEVPTWDTFTLRVGLDAMLLPDPAVMHVNFLTVHPTTYEHRRVLVSEETYLKLVKAIQDSFDFEHGHPVLIPGKGYSKSDNFYEAKGSFSALRTCNVWTASVFAQAGLKRPLWSPSKYGLLWMWD